ncbi:MAG: hypothetical protein QNJ46_07695 [Leptolyngbyaceae cyanobacterium MO_188.B28]|nr:hypothetical protein [Leptolyngbyaceae cyanobacterium MO_188.B28]
MSPSFLHPAAQFMGILVARLKCDRGLKGVSRLVNMNKAPESLG